MHIWRRMKFRDIWRRRRTREAEIDRELRDHLDLDAQEQQEAGLPPEEAAYAARRSFGNVTQIKEDVRSARGHPWLEALLQDLRYGLRQLRRNPGFTAVAIVTLALGIGANTAVFSVVNGVLLNPLPFPQPERLVALSESKPNFATGAIPYLNFLDWQRENHTFSSIGISRQYAFSLTGRGEAERLQGDWISASFFPTLGIKPILGRNFSQQDDEFGAGPVALISAGLWKRKFGGSPTVIGTNITLDGGDYTVIGVIPSTFNQRVPSFQVGDVYLPISQWNNPALRNRMAALGLHGIGRMRPGVTIAQARADLQGIARNLAAAYPAANGGTTANVQPLKGSLVGDVQPLLVLLLGAVGIVLLIACVNVANLLLARSTVRRQELAIRAALGAGRRRLIRQLLTESIVLSLAGGGLGLLAAAWCTRAGLAALPRSLPRAQGIGVDGSVLAFAAMVSILAGIFFGLVPALKTSPPSLDTTLKLGGRGLATAHHGTQGTLVVAEMALTLMLLAGAGLMIRTLARLWRVDPGFNPANVLRFDLGLPPSMTASPPEAVRAYLRELHERLISTPEVKAVSLSGGAFPMQFEDDQTFWLAGQPKPRSESQMKWSLDYIVGPDYLKVMDIPLKHGRFFTSLDNQNSPNVVVVDDVLASKYFPGRNPVGRRINFAPTYQAEIIGVVGHVKQWGLDADDKNTLRAQIYLPFSQAASMKLAPLGVGVVMRSEGASAGVIDAVRRTIRNMNREQVAYDFETMDEIISSSLAMHRVSVILLSVFAGLALLLASVGIYGVVSYSVARRTHEIGLRMALGARKSDVFRMVIGQTLRLAATGLSIGIAAALALTRLLPTFSDLLYGVDASDPATFAVASFLLTGVTVLACYIPACRATKVDPMVALRYE
jgi:putative ABC transport system permease protein